ncbi:MAG: SH3 domain-containing protein [Pseudomonadota bacterium]
MHCRQQMNVTNPGRLALVGLILLLLLSLPTLAAAKKAASPGRMLAVQAKEANFRSGPSIRNKVLFTMGRYYPVRVLKCKGDWCRVEDFEKYRAWVHRKLLGDLDAVVIKAKIANLRQRPTTKSPIVLKAQRYVPFRVIGRKGNWLEVRHDDGETGWLHKSLAWGRY